LLKKLNRKPAPDHEGGLSVSCEPNTYSMRFCATECKVRETVRELRAE
jgi:hypothetical protein